MNHSMAMSVFAAIVGLFVALQPVFGQLIPDSRRVQWAGNVGIPGGIPDRTTIFTTLSNLDKTGNTDVSGAIQTAINNCPVGQVVYLPAGIYRINNSIQITKGVTLRGAGPDQTILRGTISGRNGIVTITSGVLSGQAANIAITAGATKGSTNLTLAAADSNIKPGFIILVDQLNDGSFVINDASMPAGYQRTDTDARGTGTRNNSQAVEVKSVSGNQLTIWPPLVWNFTRSPEVYYRRAVSTATANYVTYAGIEDLSLRNVNPDTTSYYNLYFNRSAYCWAKNVRTENGAMAHITALNSFRLEIRHCTLSNSVNTASSYGYGIELDYQTCSSLVEDNIFIKTRDFIKVNAGAVGNAVLYNYHTNALANPAVPTFAVHSGGAHSAHPMMNLFEGNVTYKFVCDFYWGSSSHQTLARNWFRGPMPYAKQVGAALQCDQAASYYNIVGNVLGQPNINSNPNWTTRSTLRVSPQTQAYEYHYASLKIGYWSDSDPGGGFNANTQWANYICGGNYDFVNGSRTWYNPTTAQPIPDSYYYSSKPEYFGNLQWPPIDPAGPSYGETAIPAGYRYAYGVDPPSAPPSTNQPPVVGANASPKSGVAPLSVAFSSAGSSDPEGSSLTYNWSFGDGTTSTAANPNKTYSTAGTYTARLTVSDGVNSASSSNITITVTATVNQPPVAVASATPLSGVAPLTVAFSSAGSSDPEGTPLTYSWAFGDGTTSTSANPNKTYSTAGTYVARLTVSDGTASTASSDLTITVTGSVVVTDTIPGHALVDFEAGSDGSTVTASIMTSATKGNTWSGWRTMSNPGEGVQGSTPYLTISSSASFQLYTPALINGTVYSGAGTRGLKASMGGDNAVQLNIPSPGYQLSVGFYFRFSGPQINWSPRDVVGLRADPTGGYQFLQIYDGPQPYFHAHWQPYSSGSGIGNNVNFNRNQWYWVTMKHVAGGGTFRVRFYDPSKNYALVGESTGGVSSGTQGCTTIQIGCIKYASGSSQSVEFDNFIINTDGVFPLGPGSGGSFPTNQPPVVGANASPKSGMAPLSVAFSSAGSSDPEGSSLTYNWSFGDGTTSTAANPNKVYSTAGTYQARLTVSDGTLSTTSTNITITVTAPVNQPPVVAANATPKSGVAPLSVAFSSAGSSDPEGSTLTYNWVFGDGTTSTAANPTKVYSTAGTYQARLTVSDGVNSTTSSNISITVSAVATNQPPVAVAGASNTNGVVPLSVSFSSAGSSDPEGAALTYLWSFGDGTTSAAANPTKVYSVAGEYVARLTVSDGTNSVQANPVAISALALGSGLVAAYGFEDTAGAAVADVSGNFNHGTVTGTAWVAGKFGKALSFNGSNSLVTISDSASLRLTSGVTIGAWVYPTSTANAWMPVVFKAYDASQISYVLQGSTPSGLPSFYVSPSADNLMGTALQPNIWTHVAATYDGSTMRFYVNGVQVSSKVQTGVVVESNEPLTIGGSALYGAYWSGLVDEVRIYNRALTSVEIQNDINTPVDPTGIVTISPPQNLRMVIQ